MAAPAELPMNRYARRYWLFAATRRYQSRYGADTRCYVTLTFAMALFALMLTPLKNYVAGRD